MLHAARRLIRALYRFLLVQEMGNSKQSLRHLSSFAGIAVLLIVALSCGDAFERDTKIEMDGKNPPTFELSGNGQLWWIEVLDLSPSDVSVYAPERVIWKIKPTGKNTHWPLPKITYGIVPSGFTQEIPANGAPPALVEEKPYNVSAPTSNANGDSMIFMLRNGKASRVTESQDGSYYVQAAK